MERTGVKLNSPMTSGGGKLFYKNKMKEIKVIVFCLQWTDRQKTAYHIQSFQYFSSVPILHYLQAILCIKIITFSCISYTILFKIRRY